MMKKLFLLSVIILMTTTQVKSQWALGGLLNNRYGNSASGPPPTQWRSWGFGDFTTNGAVPRARVNINDFFCLGTPNFTSGHLFRTDGNQNVDNLWQIFTGTAAGNVTEKGRIFTDPSSPSQGGVGNYNSGTVNQGYNHFNFYSPQGDLIFTAKGANRINPPQINGIAGERLRITAGNFDDLSYTGAGMQNYTRVSIASKPNNSVTEPLAMLHIGDPAAYALGGHRPWMNYGIFMNKSNDNVYIGEKQDENFPSDLDNDFPGYNDHQDGVLVWADNAQNTGANPQPDVFRIMFAAVFANGSASGTAAHTNALETMRFAPVPMAGNPTNSIAVNIGIGDFSKNNPLWVLGNPARRLEILSDKLTAAANGNPQLRLTHDQQNPASLGNTGKYSEFHSTSLGDLFVESRDNTLTNTATRNTQERFFGFHQLTPGNTMEINSQLTSATVTDANVPASVAGTTGASGLRLTDLTTASTPYSANQFATPAVLSVNANGDIILVPDVSGGGGSAANNGLTLNGSFVQLGGPCNNAAAAALLNSREIPLNGNNLILSSYGTLGNVALGTPGNCNPTDKFSIWGNSLETSTGMHITNVTSGSADLAYISLTNNVGGNNSVIKFHSSTYTNPSDFEISTPADIDLSPNYNSNINLNAANGRVNVSSVNPANVPNNTVKMAVHDRMVIESFGSPQLNFTHDNGSGGFVYTADVGSNALEGYLSLYSSINSNASAVVRLGFSGSYSWIGNATGVCRLGINKTGPSYPLDVNGTAAATMFLPTSDSTLKTNIHAMDIFALQKVKALRPVSFEWITKSDTAMYGTQFGFTSQQVATVIPELVKTDSLGKKSLNYNGIIPFLTKAIQEQQQQIDSMKSILAACCSSNSQTAQNRNTNSINNFDIELSDVDIVVLNQNNPNPFAEQTTISFNIPKNATVSQILFYDINGRQIKAVDITKKGRGQLNVYANDLTNGVYSYTLIVDGKIIDTKKMVKQQ